MERRPSWHEAQHRRLRELGEAYCEECARLEAYQGAHQGGRVRPVCGAYIAFIGSDPDTEHTTKNRCLDRGVVDCLLGHAGMLYNTTLSRTDIALLRGVLL